MKKRIVYIVSYFLTVLLMFVIQKPLFMLYNDAFGKEAGLTDFGQVMWHGISLDATTAGYFTALPLLLVLISVWIRRLPLKKLLLPYYILASILVSVAFEVDSVTPPRIMTNKSPPQSSPPSVPKTLFSTFSSVCGVTFIIIHTIPMAQTSIANILTAIKPVETLAMASFGESK